MFPDLYPCRNKFQFGVIVSPDRLAIQIHNNRPCVSLHRRSLKILIEKCKELPDVWVFTCKIPLECKLLRKQVKSFIKGYGNSIIVPMGLPLFVDKNQLFDYTNFLLNGSKVKKKKKLS
ncbi:hypothetical protein Hanom_Chr07g00636521 [Helianthus anomalus]